jgi:hypothetical protein
MPKDYKYTGLEVVARHEPETHYETDANGMRQQVELPGFITVGVLVDGHFLGLGRYHASEVAEGIERAKAQGSDTASTES